MDDAYHTIVPVAVDPCERYECEAARDMERVIISVFYYLVNVHLYRLFFFLGCPRARATTEHAKT